MSNARAARHEPTSRSYSSTQQTTCSTNDSTVGVSAWGVVCCVCVLADGGLTRRRCVLCFVMVAGWGGHCDAQQPGVYVAEPPLGKKSQPGNYICYSHSRLKSSRVIQKCYPRTYSKFYSKQEWSTVTPLHQI
jgi:hypothetical protein